MVRSLTDRTLELIGAGSAAAGAAAAGPRCWVGAVHAARAAVVAQVPSRFCCLKKLSGVRKLTTFYLAKNGHRWVTFYLARNDQTSRRSESTIDYTSPASNFGLYDEQTSTWLGPLRRQPKFRRTQS